jgi:hypothetical protein
MVMIDLGHEKKSLGVISVTRVTDSSRPRAAQRGGVHEYVQVR